MVPNNEPKASLPPAVGIGAGLALGGGIVSAVGLAVDPGAGLAVRTLLLTHIVCGVGFSLSALLGVALLMPEQRRRTLLVWGFIAIALLGSGRAVSLPGSIGLWAHRGTTLALLVLLGLSLRFALQWRWWVVAGAALTVGAWVGAGMIRPGTTLPEGYDTPYKESAFAPSQLALAQAEALEPGALAGSVGCGGDGCHTAIVAQWQSSAHRAAATDPFYRFATTRMGEDYGTAATRLCAGCHEPGAVLAGAISDHTAADLPSRHEGVTCLVCHLTTRVADVAPHGVPANASLVIEAPDPAILFPRAPLGAMTLARHRRWLSRPALSENRFCASCHQFFIPPELGGKPGRLRLQVAETAKTPFASPEHPSYKSCVDCHMAPIAADDPAAKDGKVHDHRALGANVMLPMLMGDHAQVEATRAFRATGGLTVAIGEPTLGDDGLVVPVTIGNPNIGHDFPTGATDISEVWVEVRLTNQDGREIGRSPILAEDGWLQPGAASLSTIVLLPGGEPDFLHDLFGQVALGRHPRVKAGSERTLQVPLEVDGGAPSTATAMAVLRFRRGNQRWNAWNFEWETVTIPVTDLAVARRTVMLPHTRPRVAAAPATAPPPVSGMVWIPAGEYRVGAALDDSQAEPDERPPHRVKTEGFYIDRVPVTNAAWRRMVRKGAVKPPPPMAERGFAVVSWSGGTFPSERGDHPVTLITGPEADAYCRALGKRVPTEAEWEIAARGHSNAQWPWGDTFDPSRCNTSEAGHHNTEIAGLHPQNASPFGALDMGCNVSEWVADGYRAYADIPQDDNRADWFTHFGTGLRAIRGASFLLSAHRARVTARSFEHEEERKVIGVRCAKSGP